MNFPKLGEIPYSSYSEPDPAKPLVVQNENVCFADMDETLILWGKPDPAKPVVSFIDPYSGTQRTFNIHTPNLLIVKDWLARGFYVIGHSARGFQWAKAVTKALDLPVHQILSKPKAYLDDKKCNEWMGEHIYLDPNSNYGVSG